MKRVNWQLLLLHFLAIPCLILGVQQLQTIRWVPVIQVFQKSGLEGIQKQFPSLSMGEMIAGITMGPLYSWALAVLLGCLLSTVIVWRRQESWLIPMLLFGLTTISSWTHYYESKAVYNALAHMRLFFQAWPLETQLSIVGSTLLIIGLLPFIFTWKNRSTVTSNQSPEVAASIA